MTVQSVIEIDVNDEKFKAFQAAFERYQNILNQQSKKWEEVNKVFDKLNKKQKDFNKSVSDGGKGLKDAVITTGNIARNMASAALSAAKWVAFGAIGGGFGLGGLASSASDYRRQALGLGVSTGQLRGANVAYGRAFNAEAVLENIANIQNDPANKQILARLGGGQQGQNPADQLGTVYKNAIQQFKQFGQNPQFAEALGLTKIFSLEDLRRGANMSAEELNNLAEQFKKNKKIFELDEKISLAWQDFWYKLKSTTNELEVGFLNALKDLVPVFKDLAQSITTTIVNFLTSKDIQIAIKKFAEYLGSDEFKQDVASFFEALKALGQAAIKTAKFLGLIDKTKEEKSEETKNASDLNVLRGDINKDINKPVSTWWEGVKNKPFMTSSVNNKNRDEALRFLQAKGYNSEAVLGFIGGLQQESGFNPNATNASGHYGIAQWDEKRRENYKKWSGKSIYGSSLQEQLEFLNYELETSEKKTGVALKSGLTKAEGVKANLQYERPADPDTQKELWKKEYDTRLGIANTYNIRIDNASGGNAIVTAPALPGVTR